jgi:hypothetical protein
LDDIGTLNVLTGGPAIVAPAAPDVPGSILRGHLRQRVYWGPGEEDTRTPYPAKLWARAFDPLTNTVLSPVAQADSKGDIAIPKVAAGYDPAVECSYDGGATFFECGWGPETESSITGTQALVDYIGMDLTNDAPLAGLSLFGNVTQLDGSRCGMRNFFFDKDVNATVSVVDEGGHQVGPLPSWVVNQYGDFYVPTQLLNAQRPKNVLIHIQCEGAPVVTIPLTLPQYDDQGGLNPREDAAFANTVLPNTPPFVSAITAKLDGVTIATLAPPSSVSLPSDGIDDPERFLSYKGLDSRRSACQYYRAIGAVSGCDADGNLQNGVTFDQWKRQNKMAPYNVTPEYTATFVNQVDLNLTRNHHGTRVGPNQLSFYVCNHLGPTDATQDAIDTAVANARAGRNLVACVAMDYSVSPGVNGDRPFIKYFIFGPSGELLPSVNLDGRREKFAPGVCVGCHGGQHYAGLYPEDGTGVANVGAHYLPWDVDNFAFSSKAGLTKTDQLAQIKALNQLLLESNPEQGLADLINGWYVNGTNVPNEAYVPASYAATTDAGAATYYHDFIKPYCRTCHVAYGKPYNSEDYDTFYTGHLRGNVCGDDDQPYRDNSMPNSLVTYNRMITHGGIDAFRQFQYGLYGPDYGKCDDPPQPSYMWPPDN